MRVQGSVSTLKELDSPGPYTLALRVTIAVLHRQQQQQERLWPWVPHSLPARKQLSQGTASLEALGQLQRPPQHRQGLP